MKHHSRQRILRSLLLALMLGAGAITTATAAPLMCTGQLR